MRYNPEDKYYSENNPSKKHDPTRRLKKPRKKKANQSEIRYITAQAIVTSRPRNECSLYQRHPQKGQTVQNFKKRNREEVVVTANLYTDGCRDSYVIRFVHKRCIEPARRLQVGSHLNIELGYFNYRPGRRQTEFWVKKFTSV